MRETWYLNYFFQRFLFFIPRAFPFLRGIKHEQNNYYRIMSKKRRCGVSSVISKYLLTLQ